MILVSAKSDAIFASDWRPSFLSSFLFSYFLYVFYMGNVELNSISGTSL
jgi:hypothetical protein